ncbi:MAG: flavoprotein, partial [Mesorhizobium sp.]|nr:flavoprotein [Mesorhizobium sp.]
RDYLVPFAALPEIAPNLKLRATVTAVARKGHGKVSNEGRKGSPFVVRYDDAVGEHRVLARAVIDSSGTWSRPNPIGIDGLAVPGEREAAGRIAYGIPDVIGIARGDYAGKRVLVIGGGHSAINVALALMELQGEAPDTEIFWALRHSSVEKLLGGGLNDQLPERGALGLAAKQAMEDGRLNMLTSFAVDHIETKGDCLLVEAMLVGKPFGLSVDRIVVTTGFRPDLSFLGELRIALDPAVEAPPALAPLIDPNFHSCGTVPPHGIHELAHPEPGFTIVGSKSYGRAPTFLMVTGYEQVRSVVADIAGDHKAAREVRLVLPETGVCTGVPLTGPEPATCCGGPTPDDVDACCVKDADAKAKGGSGCGCASVEIAPAAEDRCCRSAA